MAAIKKELNDLEIKAHLDGRFETRQSRKMVLKEIMFQLEKTEVLDIKQKARVKWSQMGDENSKYFHRILNQNRRMNCIQGISLNGTWITDPRSLKAVAKDFF